MDSAEPHRNITIFSEPGASEERNLCQFSSGMTLEEFHQWQKLLMINPTMSVNPLLTLSGQPRMLSVPSPFDPRTVDRDVLPSAVAPADPRHFCVSSQLGPSVMPNGNMPNTVSNRAYSGWSMLPPESIKTMPRRTEMIQRHNTARTEMEMYAIYQQRRMEQVNPKGLMGLGMPFLYSSSVPAGPAGPSTFPGRSTLPVSDLHCHRNTLRNLQGNPVLVATGPHLLDRWEQKCHRLRRGTGNQKVLDDETDSSKSQGECKLPGQTHATPYEEDELAKDPETEALSNRKPRETNEKPPAAHAKTSAELESLHRTPWAAHSTPLEAKAWDSGKEKAFEQSSAVCSENPGPSLALPGTRELVTPGERLSLDEDIQKWTVDDVHSFIRGLPGCSGYAQVFKDHAIDGETLPLLTEEHLRDTMGLKLGPALKIQSQIYSENSMDSSSATFTQLRPISEITMDICQN